MAFSSELGMEISLDRVPRTKELFRNDHLLFAESNSRFLVEVPEKRKDDFKTFMREAECAEIGKVTKEGILSVTGLNGKQAVHEELEELRRHWKRTLGACNNEV
jgi:phosphoribosylformylglycinamidine synthase